MLKLRDAIVELYRKAATSLPSDMESALQSACRKEKKGSSAEAALYSILRNVELARETGRPICQDTGVPTFFVKVPCGLSHLELKKTIRDATRGHKKDPLRPMLLILSNKIPGIIPVSEFPYTLKKAEAMA
jgi:fumarate hydratase class I